MTGRILFLATLTLLIASTSQANIAWQISAIPRPANISDWGAHAVSDDGSRIVGIAQADDGQGGTTLSLFRWQDDGTVVLIPFPGPNPITARGISNDGTVIVGQETPPKAWRWAEDTGWSALADLTDGNGQTFVTRLSSDGYAVLGAAYDDNPNEEDPSVKSLRNVVWQGTGPPSPVTDWFDDFQGSQNTGTYSPVQKVVSALSMNGTGSEFVGFHDIYDESWDISYARGVFVDGFGDASEIAAPVHEPDTPLETALVTVSPLGLVAAGRMWPRFATGFPTTLILSVRGSLETIGAFPSGVSTEPRDITDDGNFVVLGAHVWSNAGGFQSVPDFLGQFRCLDTSPYSQMQLLGVATDGVTLVGNALAITGGGVIWRSGVQTGPDEDADGLLDAWEIFGLDVNGDGTVDLDLPGMGADPERKDLFVEVDRMRNVPFSTTALDLVVAAFYRAPVVNPNFSTGIDLHIDYGTIDMMGRTAVSDWNTFGEIKDGDSRTLGHFGTDAERASPNWPAIRCAREVVFRYGLFVDKLSDGRGGISEASGLAEETWSNDFMLALGKLEEQFAASKPPRLLDDTMMAWVFMHELGHTIGLDEGGNDNDTNKPNYVSVMNYAWPHMRKLNGDMLDLDYSRETIGPLNERFLFEAVGVDSTKYRDVLSIHSFYDPAVFGQARQFVLLNGGRHDWDGDGTASFDPGFSVEQDINRWEDKDPENISSLTGHNDWPVVLLPLGSGGVFGSAVYGDPASLGEADLPADRTAFFLANPPNDDMDRDGLSVFEEAAAGTEHNNADTDGDGLCDGGGPSGTAPECALGGEDTNGNGVYDVGVETDPNARDTDGDGAWDGAEIAAGTDPLDPEDRPPVLVPTAGGVSLGFLISALTLCGLRRLGGRSRKLEGAPIRPKSVAG